MWWVAETDTYVPISGQLDSIWAPIPDKMVFACGILVPPAYHRGKSAIYLFCPFYRINLELRVHFRFQP